MNNNKVNVVGNLVGWVNLNSLLEELNENPYREVRSRLDEDKDLKVYVECPSMVSLDRKEVQQIVDEKLSYFGIDKKIEIDNDIYYTLVSYYNLNDYTPPTRHDEETMFECDQIIDMYQHLCSETSRNASLKRSGFCLQDLLSILNRFHLAIIKDMKLAGPGHDRKDVLPILNRLH